MDTSTKKNEKSYDEHATEWHVAMAANFGHIYLEKPAMVRLLPDLKDKDVLCIGVGSGEELEEILERDPRKVVAIDISGKLLEIAQSRFPQVEFLKRDMVQTGFPAESFDYVYSSLTFHYARDWDALLSEVSRILRKGGRLLFSTHHPVYWGTKNSTGISYTNQRGVTLTEHAAMLPGGVEITYYNHASEESIHEALRHAEFEIQEVFCPKVQDAPLHDFTLEERERYAELRSKNERSPLFLVISAVKNQ